MNRPRRVQILLIVSISFLTFFRSSGQSISTKTVKIACVGTSITYGSGIANREKNAYPTQLQCLLGESYNVQNFGMSGSTLLEKGDKPYWTTKAYPNALEFTPDIVFIKLGTNDSKSQNRAYLENFQSDYVKLIDSFKARNSAVRVVLLLPLPSFAEDSTKIWNPVIKEEILPHIQNVAYDTHNEVIDLYQLFIDRSDLLPDGVHPTSLGAAVIAQRLYEAVVKKPIDQTVNLETENGLQVEEETNFYGFPLAQFNFNGVACKLARPKKVAAGMPWVLRARFWGHEPQSDIALLERGFHVAYCDVSNLFGSREAVQRWNSFYDLMTKAGLSEKVVLEGMSRGGLIIYNWAEQNADKVACIYADAPVLDGKSWPGGLKKAKGSPEDWERFKKVNKLKNKRRIKVFKGDPIHNTKSIAKGGYPMLHVCGEIDEVVPIAENTIPFVKEIRQYGGTIETIYKPDIGHHPHNLQNPTPIVNFILRATGQKLNFAVIPSPSAEYRSGAGWIEGTDWWTQARDIDSLCQASEQIDLLLIGNSITQSFGGNRPHVTIHSGKTATDIYFKNLKWINAGISGDRTQQILWRLKHGAYEKARPKNVVLTIGVNNFPFETAQEIVSGIKEVGTLAKAKFPDSNILLFGPLPTGIERDSERRQKYRKVHEMLKSLSLPSGISYHEITALFLNTDGSLNPDLYSEDGIHLKPDGYSVWGKYITENIK